MPAVAGAEQSAKRVVTTCGLIAPATAVFSEERRKRIEWFLRQKSIVMSMTDYREWEFPRRVFGDDFGDALQYLLISRKSILVSQKEKESKRGGGH